MQTLRSIAPSNLHAFLSPYSAYFNTRGFDLELISEHTFANNCKALISILGYPDSETPQGLIDALYHVNTMATQAGMDILVEEFGNAGHIFDDPESTPADIAVLAWITNKELFEKVFAKQHELSWRIFRVYSPEGNSSIESAYYADGLSALETALNDWSEMNRLGRHCKVFQIPSHGERCYIVRRGQPYSRVSAITKGRSSSIVFQPETFDIVICDFIQDQLHVSAATKATRDTYRKLFSEHMFGDEHFFSNKPVYTLGPIASKGKESLYCDDIPGLVDVKLRQVEMSIGGGSKLSTIWKGTDVYLNTDFIRNVSSDSNISMASIAIKFEDGNRPRSAEVRPPNILRYRRDGDVRLIGHLLRSRGFVIKENHGGLLNG